MRALLLVLLAGLLSPAQADPLNEAYKKEFAFLEAEKRALAKRVREVKGQAKKDTARLEARIAAVQRQVLALNVQGETLAESLQAVEREAELATEGLEGLDGLVQQIARTYTPYDVQWPPATLAEPEPDEAPAGAASDDEAARLAAAAAAARVAAERSARRITHGFERVLPLLAERAGVRKTPGAFFLADGSKVEGTLVKLGDVATYGVSPQAAGALTPAGDGRLKLDPAQGEATARALDQGAPPPSMGVFLYESLDQNFEVKKARTPLDVVRAGGAIAWVIVGLGGLAALLMLGRVLLLGLAMSPVQRMLREAVPHVDAARFADASAACGKRRGAAARVLTTLAARLADDRDDLERLIVERMLAEEGRIDRFGAAVLVAAAVAPLLGLLGTVTGMISTFDVITEFGTGNPKLLSGGISEALITTELGLLVAIPALLGGNLLNGWAERIKTGIEQGALVLMNHARVGAAAPDAEEG